LVVIGLTGFILPLKLFGTGSLKGGGTFKEGPTLIRFWFLNWRN